MTGAATGPGGATEGQGGATEWLFSYGTLQDPQVQLATFGRRLEGHPDALPGHEVRLVEITDAAVLATSGQTHHPILVPVPVDGDGRAAVPGTVLALTPAELAAADDYEVDDYTRVAVSLASGRRAWVYVASAPVGSEQAD